MLASPCLLFSVVGLLSCFVYVQTEPAWITQRVTWAPNFFSSRAFAKLPRTEQKAKRDGFARLAGDCAGRFLGNRYIKGLDTASVLIYDSNGYIAGIQNGIPRNQVISVNTTFPFAHSSAYQLDRIGEDEIYFITAYFVDPYIICKNGRTRDQFEEEGTGTGLYLQNGTNPIRDSSKVPLYEKDMEGTDWVKGGCFITMGIHYWYRAHEDMSCSDFFPITVIYNRRKLTAFAFVFFGYYEFSKRLEHPPSAQLSKFLPTPVPKCLLKEYDISGGFSTMHVFFNILPWNILC